MCDPVYLTYAAIAMSADAAYKKSEAEQKQAEYNSAVNKNNAELAEIQAQDIMKRGDQEAIAARRQASQLRGQQRVSMAARGLDLGQGTPLSLLDQTDYFAAVDQATIDSNTNKDIFVKRAQAAGFRSEAAMYAATAEAKSPLLSAVTAGVQTAAMSSSLMGKPGTGAADKWSLFGGSDTSAAKYSWAGGSSVGGGGTGLKATPTSTGW